MDQKYLWVSKKKKGTPCINLSVDFTLIITQKVSKPAKSRLQKIMKSTKEYNR